MTPGEAAWVREHVFTPPMRKTHREVPGFYTSCTCQAGLSHWCQHDQHNRCHRATALRSAETMICGRGGVIPAHFSAPYTHQTDIYATGPRYEEFAHVWLADRVCRWICPCSCHSLAPVQDGLFDLAVSR